MQSPAKCMIRLLSRVKDHLLALFIYLLQVYARPMVALPLLAYTFDLVLTLSVTVLSRVAVGIVVCLAIRKPRLAISLIA